MINATHKATIELIRLGKGKPLRIEVTGGGCSGMSYKLSFDTISPLDKVFEQNGVKIICDNKSFLFLNGLELDFSDGLNGTGFTFSNPNVKRSCGCGSSFSV